MHKYNKNNMIYRMEIFIVISKIDIYKRMNLDLKYMN